MPKPKSGQIQERHKVDTIFLLLAQYGATAVIPLDLICQDYFCHLKLETLLRKIRAGDVALPVVQMGSGRESARGVHLIDFARWLDQKAAEARAECDRLAALKRSIDLEALQGR